ncbi:hypothetical protein DIZ81_07170 [Legionella taurinensis]|uniref:Inner membrane protein AmpE n=1 Tax=Legionella taurinensis TaxID=70611 RepID=A0A3A5L7Z9_9GAMM|nr:hypothetical protein [Legionella taurinensis]MDX1837146.1 hypothetical protein [Legionella taurinensis]PUT40374.1 hypothetical protein DB744_07170 [Legionella taurinensis]PUT40535.1 hypothetical protein DB746_11670 [Legionella taurinensis]PUT42780.1 hypothetical protein DB743_12155 [Legionella taurinensis]PUT48435.1 hypothetical protein DB745_05570 [Legionella taurinensis]
MKLLVIVLCLFSERYLIHAASLNRFTWFTRYFNAINQRLPEGSALANPYLRLLAVILPPVLITSLVLFLFCHILFGFIYLLLNIVIFYYCLGPNNPFYPVASDKSDEEDDSVARDYFAAVNGQLFAVIFWYILLGPLAVLVYRLLSLSQVQAQTATAAATITRYLDWITARVTVLLYLLVGNFQRGFSFFTQYFLSQPDNNELLLGQGGVLAARTSENDAVTLPQAQTLVEHALIVYLVFLAFFTLVAWL